ncbi:hypothetical protein MB46_02595 [Arthrobacter alpinus]|nr:hypothetical protein MB46_02595 [Arthrobacter alpinus]
MTRFTISHPSRLHHWDTDFIYSMIFSANNLHMHADHCVVANMPINLYDTSWANGDVVANTQPVRATNY